MKKVALLVWIGLTCVVGDETTACDPCADGLDAFEIDDFCESAVELAPSVEDGSVQCLTLQLLTYQADCCDTPPEDFCTLCPDGSDDYNHSKVIPFDAGDTQSREITCERVATNIRYLKDDVETYGLCNLTERVEAQVWCECPGTESSCSLTCSDGNAPPDLSKADPVYEQTCERLMYEYTTLTETECLDPIAALNFDAKAFCCNEAAPENCSICPEGSTLLALDTEVVTEFYGTVTCGDIHTYASFLPNSSCPAFIAFLVDDPINAASVCCDIPEDTTEDTTDDSTSGGHSVAKMYTLFGAVLALVSVLSM
eukprot:Nitzschia sp. Nitz4//scaffold34_size148208//104759//105797//NITZ4_002990-RA/size148208-processed-gene-0.86-mRNA-1//-1//CDS//3329548825//9075//frame0